MRTANFRAAYDVLVGIARTLGPSTTMTGRGAAQPPSLFFVDGTNGNDGHDGKSPDRSLKTIQEGIDRCLSGRGDIVYIKPGTYDEALSVSGKDYVHLIGAYEAGYARPDVGPSTGTSPALTVTESQGFVAIGMRFYSDGIDIHVVDIDSNGFHLEDCVLDGDSAQAATKALLRLKGNADDDSYTASEGKVIDCLFRGGDGYGIAFDTGAAPGNGVGVTHAVVKGCRFIAGVAEDIIALDSGGGVYAMQDSLIEGCFFMSRNKATHIDLDTNLGAANTGNMIANCYFHDDTIDTTAIKVATANAAVVGCFGLDGVIDGDALD